MAKGKLANEKEFNTHVINESNWGETVIPNSVDMATVVDSEPHDWDVDKAKVKRGDVATCKRCDYKVRIADEGDLDFIDLAVPCDQVIIEQVTEV